MPPEDAAQTVHDTRRWILSLPVFQLKEVGKTNLLRNSGMCYLQEMFHKMSWKQSLNFKEIKVENDGKKARQMDDILKKSDGPCNNTFLYKYLLFDTLHSQKRLVGM